MSKCQNKSLYSRLYLSLPILAFLYVLIPPYLAAKSPPFSIKPLFIFYLINFCSAFLLFKRYRDLRFNLEYQLEQLQEKLNILQEKKNQASKNNVSLNDKIARYISLKKVVEDLNKDLSLDSVASNLTSFACDLISKDKGVCMLYLVDHATHKLNLYKAKKNTDGMVIKDKEGDIFDHWVLRHATPLLIEDIKNDFRFDSEKLKPSYLRPFSSLISSPFLTENRFLGILRLDSPESNFYSQDDLRFLVRICDLGAVALENSELFHKTEELAIHDALTSLYTKGYFLERLKEEFARAIRQKRPLTLLMLDIDFFKNYNDKYGHTAGDAVLQKIAKRMQESFKDLSACAARFGGEEFCVILPLAKKEGFDAAARLCREIESEKIILRRQQTGITVSIGVSAFPEDAAAEDELMQKADRALYMAKQKGRNRACCI